MGIESVAGGAQSCVAPEQNSLVFALMRFGLYLMFAAFVLMGAELAYALYQLARLVL